MTLRFLLLFMALAFPVRAHDLAGSADHPLVGRFDGAVISHYDAQELDVVDIASTPGAIDKVVGAVTRIAYLYPEGTSMAEAAETFEDTVKARGFEVLMSCAATECAGIGAGVDRFGPLAAPPPPENHRYVLARRTDMEGTVHASLLVSGSEREVAALLTVTESGDMSFRAAGAGEIERAMTESGRITLRGISFDTDEATIRPESEQALAELSVYLWDNPGLEVVIVGHTDNTGPMVHNLTLSARRAEAVRTALVEQFGIDPERLNHAGAGYLSPIAPNTSPRGRALNRRVELVAR